MRLECLRNYLSIKGTVTIIKYKKKKGEVVVTDGNLNFTIGGVNEIEEDINL